MLLVLYVDPPAAGKAAALELETDQLPRCRERFGARRLDVAALFAKKILGIECVTRDIEEVNRHGYQANGATPAQ